MSPEEVSNDKKSMKNNYSIKSLFSFGFSRCGDMTPISFMLKSYIPSVVHRHVYEMGSMFIIYSIIHNIKPLKATMLEINYKCNRENSMGENENQNVPKLIIKSTDRTGIQPLDR